MNATTYIYSGTYICSNPCFCSVGILYVGSHDLLTSSQRATSQLKPLACPFFGDPNPPPCNTIHCRFKYLYVDWRPPTWFAYILRWLPSRHMSNQCLSVDMNHCITSQLRKTLLYLLFFTSPPFCNVGKFSLRAGWISTAVRAAAVAVVLPQQRQHE